MLHTNQFLLEAIETDEHLPVLHWQVLVDEEGERLDAARPIAARSASGYAVGVTKVSGLE